MYLLEGAEKEREEHLEQGQVGEQQLHTLAAGVAAGKLKVEDGEHRSFGGRGLQRPTEVIRDMAFSGVESMSLAHRHYMLK